jgi:hypothetical protein
MKCKDTQQRALRFTTQFNTKKKLLVFHSLSNTFVVDAIVVIIVVACCFLPYINEVTHVLVLFDRDAHVFSLSLSLSLFACYLMWSCRA